MSIHLLSNQESFSYDTWIKTHPQGNLWQSLERKTYLEILGKEVRIYVEKKNENVVSSALVAIDRTTFGLSTWEIPRGPIGENTEALMQRILTDAKKDKCMAFYFCSEAPSLKSWISQRHIHCEATRIIDLTVSEQEILNQMKQKGRYNIRVAEKHGVSVKQSDDVDAFYKIVKETGQRDNFTTLSKEKYLKFLSEIPNAFLLLAYENNEPIAGLLGVIWNKKGIYYYGCSSYAHRALMAPYLLQWEAITLCKQKGCVSYDLLGIAPPDAPSSHAWAGISSFKEKFGGDVLLCPAERQIILRPVANALLKMKRKFWR